MMSACFIDADNVPNPQGTTWGAELERLLDSSCRIRSSFGVGKTQSKQLSDWLSTHAFKQLNSDGPVKGKNTADIQMTFEIAETAFKHVNQGSIKFIIVTGDSDFMPVVRKLFELGHEICLVAQEGHLLKMALTLGVQTIKISNEGPSSRLTTHVSDDQSKADLLSEVALLCQSKLAGSPPLKLVQFAHYLNHRLGAKWYERLGFARLIDALQQLSSLKLTPTLDQDYVVSWVHDYAPKVASKSYSIEDLERLSEELLSQNKEMSLVNFAINLNQRLGAKWYELMGYKKMKDVLVTLSTIQLSPVGNDFVVSRAPRAGHDAQGAQPSIAQITQPSVEQLAQVLDELYREKDRYALPQILSAFRLSYPHFDYQQWGHSKFKPFILERFGDTITGEYEQEGKESSDVFFLTPQA